MRKILTGIVTVSLVATMGLALAACGGSNDNNNPTTASTTTETTTGKASGESFKIEFGDFDGQQALSKKIQNMECTGADIEIEGTSEKLGSSYSIGQRKDGEHVGTSYKFSGEYPADGAHVIVKGKIVTEGLTSYIDASSVEVVE